MIEAQLNIAATLRSRSFYSYNHHHLIPASLLLQAILQSMFLPTTHCVPFPPLFFLIIPVVEQIFFCFIYCSDQFISLSPPFF